MGIWTQMAGMNRRSWVYLERKGHFQLVLQAFKLELCRGEGPSYWKRMDVLLDA